MPDYHGDNHFFWTHDGVGHEDSNGLWTADVAGTTSSTSVTMTCDSDAWLQPPLQTGGFGQEPQKEPCDSGPKTIFAAQQGVFAKSDIDWRGLSFNGDLDLGSYNTPTSGSPYWSKGIGLGISFGSLKIGFSYQAKSYNGGLSFEPAPLTVSFLTHKWGGDMNASDEGIDYEFALPQAFSGFTVSHNVVKACKK